MVNYALITFNSEREIKNFIIMIILWGVILAIIIYVILFSLGNIKISLIKLFFTKNLLATSWGKSNYLATFFVLIIPLAVGYYIYSKTFYVKLFLLLSIFLMTSALIITFSRGGILSFTFAILMLLSYTMRLKNFIKLLALIASIGIILYLNPAVQLLLDSISNVNKSYSYFTRINFYKDVWNTFLENPFTGVGLGNLGFYAKFKISTHASAHNIILGLIGETGILGAFLFLYVLASIYYYHLKKFIREKNRRTSILRWSFICSFTGIFIHSMMEPNFEGLQFSILFWPTLAVFYKI